MNVGDKVKFYESAKHKLEEAIITKVHGNGLFNVEVLRGKVKAVFHSVGTAMELGGAYIMAHTKPTPTPSPTPAPTPAPTPTPTPETKP